LTITRFSYSLLIWLCGFLTVISNHWESFSIWSNLLYCCAVLICEWHFLFNYRWYLFLYNLKWLINLRMNLSTFIHYCLLHSIIHWTYQFYKQYYHLNYIRFKLIFVNLSKWNYLYGYDNDVFYLFLLTIDCYFMTAIAYCYAGERN
jgi:hypothetical protein